MATGRWLKAVSCGTYPKLHPERSHRPKIFPDYSRTNILESDRKNAIATHPARNPLLIQTV
jgi:hypothetical protein